MGRKYIETRPLFFSLARQCTVAQRIIPAAVQLLAVSASSRCGDTVEQWQHLGTCLLEIGRGEP